jgi:hypothetical protein
VVDKVALGQVFLRVSPVNIILPWLSIRMYIIWGMKTGQLVGAVHRQFHPIDMNNNNNNYQLNAEPASPK